MTNAGAAAAAAKGVALGARTARSCDGCMRRRARWHCPADDAFLCQTCDAAVHSANPLARRHHRVRLPSASSSSPPRDPEAPAWLSGLKRRPRTPRSKPGSKHEAASAAASSAAVPDLEEEESGSGTVGYNDHGMENDDEDLLYRVPVFDPMLAELYNPVIEGGQKPACLISSLTETSPEFASGLAEADGLSGFDVPDMELASFAADMESLLMGVDDGFDDLGFLDDEKPQVNVDLGMDFEAMAAPEREDKKRKRPEMILKLNYEGVIASWARDGGPPWFHGERPHLDPGESWPDFPAGIRGCLGGAVTAVTGGEREARVSRYREKRRTRLFAKKIRYEVRKLNAEKRPRMKGRFVKRASLPPLPRPPPPQKQKQPPRALPQVGMVLAPELGAHGRFRF
ncbi:zinc finger protein CONSTANS-LIKE 16-like [Phragmites australis]|uniref:zinc finger protein CONSTANS-LIKE 16-like n=1 Tax=Phragmites australis TaxID=29695 RepID=UPI002D79CB0D|nr:zinc finger protein CONSTANS-LIKE 16-like [Phragmites australis]